MSNSALLLDQYRILDEPYYRPVGAEIALFSAAYASRMPVMLERADRLRQDPVHRVYVLAAWPP